MSFSKFASALAMAAGIALASVVSHAQEKIPPTAEEEFVGTTLADPALRNFLGGLPKDAACHCIKWRLLLRPPAENLAGAGRFRAVATYGLPGRDDPNQIETGPTVELEGKFELAKSREPDSPRVVFRLQNADSKTLELSRLGQNLLHFNDELGKLKVGDAGWSFTLNRKPQGGAK